MNILGISAFYHDSAACLLKDGNILAAAQEERFVRKKHYSGFPYNAICYCLEHLASKTEGLDYVVFYEKPKLKFRRILSTFFSIAPDGSKTFPNAMESWFTNKLWIKRYIYKYLKKMEVDIRSYRIVEIDHHQSHAGSAFFPSPFSNAAIMSVDGVGEWTTTSIWHGRENKISKLRELNFRIHWDFSIRPSHIFVVSK